MSEINAPEAGSDSIFRRSQQLFKEQCQDVYRRTDRLFAALMLVQWLAGIVVALTVSPLTWSGSQSYVHLHVWAAIFLGGVITSLPIYLAIQFPGQAVTRHTIGICQMLYSALLIHLTGGRIETHFHIFGSLAFLAFYRDWRVLISASAVVAIDHLLRGLFWPQSVYGVLTASPWRVVEHTFWVIFEDVFLIAACQQTLQEMWGLARRQATLETNQRAISIQYAISDLLSQTSDLLQAAPRILETISKTLGWQASAIWQVDPTSNALVNTGLWHEPNMELLILEATGRKKIYEACKELSGTAWASGEPEWVGDLAQRSAADAAPPAVQCRAHGAVAVPIMFNGRALGVMEYVCREVRPFDKDLLRLLESLGRQIGQFMERKAAEDKVHAVESSSDAIITLDASGLVVSWNRGAHRIYGYAASEMIGDTLLSLLPADKSSEQTELLHKLVYGETIQNYETEAITKAGNLIYVSMTYSPVADGNGNITGASIIARDISERREAERRVSEFYSMVSHELRTPLTSIRGALGLIESGMLEEYESRELVQVARSSSDRLIRLINDILDLRKIEAGKMEMDCKPVSPRQLIMCGIDAVRTMSDQEKMTVTLDDCTEQSVLADTDRITQVLINLLSNAIKFSSRGSKILVTAGNGSAGYVRISVVDNGPGIPADQIHKLFGKFQQLDSSDTRQQGGTGLGLSICKAIVEEHGGRIGVNSEPGTGSTFWFELPSCTAARGDSDSTSRQSYLDTVMVIEDDHDLSSVLCKQLEVDGYRSLKASSLSEARAQLSEVRPDVILLDLTLPDGNGLELIEELKVNPKTSAIPVIVITGKQRDPASCSNATIIDWLVKPFDQQRLATTLRKALSINEPAKVLVVDDDESTRLVLSKQLRSLHLKCLEANDGMEAFRLMEQAMPDLIILDVAMPRIDGFRAVELMREAHMASTPLIIYSGRDLCADERESLRLGITRYLTKGRTSEDQFLSVVRELLSQVATSREKLPVNWIQSRLAVAASSNPPANGEANQSDTFPISSG